jgi:hypothetical protein
MAAGVYRQKYELDWRWTVSQCQVLMNPKWVCVVNLRGIVNPECRKNFKRSDCS